MPVIPIDTTQLFGDFSYTIPVLKSMLETERRFGDRDIVAMIERELERRTKKEVGGG